MKNCKKETQILSIPENISATTTTSEEIVTRHSWKFHFEIVSVLHGLTGRKATISRGHWSCPAYDDDEGLWTPRGGGTHNSRITRKRLRKGGFFAFQERRDLFGTAPVSGFPFRVELFDAGCCCWSGRRSESWHAVLMTMTVRVLCMLFGWVRCQIVLWITLVVVMFCLTEHWVIGRCIIIS